MTDDEAQRHALKRWGSPAMAYRTYAPLLSAEWLYHVGKRKTADDGGDRIAIYGVGQSWEEAFAMADRYRERISHAPPN